MNGFSDYGLFSNQGLNAFFIIQEISDGGGMMDTKEQKRIE